MSALQSLCLFLVSGRTYTFRDVVLEHDNETAVTFQYRAMSDGQYKRATFYKEHVAGIAQVGLPVMEQADSGARGSKC